MLDDEELPELSSSEPDSNSKNNDPQSSESTERSSSSRQNVRMLTWVSSHYALCL